MQTNDNEYFRSAVTDEWNTPRPLTGQEQAEEQKQKTFRTKRHKTAQRAFSLAAPVAVVAVAATLVTTVAGPVCPVCGEEACHYFRNGRTGQFLTKEDLTPVTLAEPMTDTSLTWNGITVDGQFSEDKNEWDYFYTLTMENGQIAYLWEENLYYLISERDVEYDNAFTVKRVQADVSPGESQYVGYAGEKEQNLQFYVQMVYLPDGSTPEEYTDQGDPSLIESVGRPHTYAVREVGTEGLWLQAYSFTDSLTPEEMLDAMKPVVLPAPQTDMELGSGMLMRWTDGMLERFYKDESVYHTSTLTLADGSDITVSCTSRLDTTSYEFHLKVSDMQEARFILRYTLYDWNEVQQAWARVYDQAAPTGHIGISTSIELQPVTVNDIVYRVYMNPKLREVGQKMSAYTLFFVPENQPTLMIEINADVIDEKMMEGASLEDVVWGENWKNILSWIYPLGSEPEAVPTPTPTPEPTPTPTPEIKQQLSFNEMIPQYPFNEFNTDEDEQWRKVEFYTRLDGQLTKLGFPFSNGMGWGYYGDDYYVKGHPYEQDGKMLVYLEVLKFWDGTIPQQSDQYGVDTEMYPTYIDWSQTKSYAMRAAEGGCFIRVYSFLDELTAQEILDNITDKAVSEFR